ncbi:B12-binding domain-containing protein [Methanolobus vulcani]|uniref:Methanol--cobalamin methyltransferase n=1 Tax=Methanolobus vulcani TaxID=38026 RepID=A0A7Z8KNN0_9EURY|nr:methyltransferase cognate corrinoid protein [Methanolobus vulcani]TQD25074.1 methanol--cobalamin methyltransferase [Methanolobus vulcani]
MKIKKQKSPEELASERYPSDPYERKIAEAVFNGDEDAVIRALKEAIDFGFNPLSLINQGLLCGMDIVSTLYEEGILYLPDIIMASNAMKDGIEFCKKLASKAPDFKGKVVSYVVEGDIHDIGKTIVCALLVAKGFEVIDLGKDVPVNEVIDSVKKEQPIMLSGTALLTMGKHSLKEVNERLLEEGIRIPFLCGGRGVNKDFVSNLELGLYCEDGASVPKIAEEILKGTTIEELRDKYVFSSK